MKLLLYSAIDFKLFIYHFLINVCATTQAVSVLNILSPSEIILQLYFFNIVISLSLNPPSGPIRNIYCFIFTSFMFNFSPRGSKQIFISLDDSVYFAISDKVAAATLSEIAKYTESSSEIKICFDPRGEKLNMNEVNIKQYIFLIGPEGGFSDNDITMLKKYNWRIISLGDRILRTETACVVAQTLMRKW